MFAIFHTNKQAKMNEKKTLRNKAKFIIIQDFNQAKKYFFFEQQNHDCGDFERLFALLNGNRFDST